MGADPVGRSLSRRSHRHEMAEPSASASVRAVGREDPRREYGARPSQHVTETSAQREHRLMSQVINKVGGEQNWKSLSNNPAAQWKVIKNALPKSDYEFLVKTAKDRKAAAEAQKEPYVSAKLYTESKSAGLIKRNSAVIVGVRKNGEEVPIASSTKSAIGPIELGQKTQGPGFEKRQILFGIPVGQSGQAGEAARMVDRIANTGNRYAAEQAAAETGRSGNPALSKVLSSLPQNPTNQQVFNAIHRHYGNDYDKTYSRMKQDFGITPKQLTDNRDGRFSSAGAVQQKAAVTNNQQHTEQRQSRPAEKAAPSPQAIINAAYDLAGVSRRDHSDAGFDKVAKHIAKLGPDQEKIFRDALRQRAQNN